MPKFLLVLASLVFSGMAAAACYNNHDRLMICSVFGKDLITDSATGLVWDAQADQQAATFADAQRLVSPSVFLNSAWRLPTVEELFTLATASHWQGYFQGWQPACYWTLQADQYNGELTQVVDYWYLEPKVYIVPKVESHCYVVKVRRAQ